MKNSVAFIIVLLIFNSCIQGLEVFTGKEVSLIVDGTLTDLEGPHRIKLNVTREYNKTANYEKVNSASVIIEDDLGNVEKLTPYKNGEYYTSSEFKGEAGRTYILKITLFDGEYYESRPEKMVRSAQINNGNFEFKTVENISDNGVISEEKILAFNVDFKDEVGVRNYYRWRYRETFEITAPLTNAGIRSTNRCPIKKGRAKDCWVTGFDLEFLKLENDDYFDGKLIKDYFVYSVGIDDKFEIGYDALLQCYSLTKEAYTYWHELEQQLNNNGTIFETSNYQIKGNLFNPDNEEEIVLGYFGVSSVSEKHVFVNNEDVNVTYIERNCEPASPEGCIPAACISCLEYSPRASKIKPEFWPN